MSASAEAAYTRSKSVDFTELQQPKHSDPWPRPPRLSLESACWNIKALAECCDDEINGERFGAVLGISSSIASPSDYRKGFQLKSKQKVGKYSAVKRVFSMRRSASVSERYYRIDKQSYTPADHFDGEDVMDVDEETRSAVNPKTVEEQQQHKGGKIMKACKRFFNLK
ncbi:hypothetical protein MLD38_023142 [Melastoma candidum]|uniref:Uncharacterized protein n=1 Tax=Melastoma candidum TaxID=119954 RepID=A0ACB9QQ16_9MYRT|nr:hypothetical protein MLD38_023142 [Melastoma candidum]